MADADILDVFRIRPLLLLGVGNPLRGDDAIGDALAREIEAHNDGQFHSRPVAVSVENALCWIREESGGNVLLVDAVYDEELPEGAWALYPVDRLDSVCHTAHSIPLSLLIAFWRKEVPGLKVYFLGISIRDNTEMAPLSPTLRRTLEALKEIFARAREPR